MRARRPRALVFGFLGTLTAFATLFACSGDDNSLTGHAPQPGGSSGGGLDATTSSRDGGDGGSPVDAFEAAVDTGPPLNSVDGADIPDGGLSVTQGVITCGIDTCNAFAGDQCCASEDASVCQLDSLPCTAGSSSFECNESADCVVGTVCCGAVAEDDAGTVTLVTRCAASCGDAAPEQFCRTNGECKDAGEDGGGCVVQACSDGNTYEMCGVYAAPSDSGIGFTCQPM